MSIKVKQALTQGLIKIENDEFDEDTIRTLLIVSREYLKYSGLIKELAHFIAHPTRDRGIFHKKVNCRYTKFKLVDEQFSKSNISILQSTITNESELSDFLLGAISIEQIDAKLYDILYRDGLEDLPESHLIHHTGFNKKQAEIILNENYTKQGDFYTLNLLKTEKLISKLEALL